MSDPPSAPDWFLQREMQVRGLFRDRRRKLQLLASSRCPKGGCGGLLGAACRLPDGLWVWIAGACMSPSASREEFRSQYLRDFHGTPDDVADAVAARMQRKRLLKSGSHRYVAILEEAVLRQVIGGAEVMAGQLGYLLDATALPSLSLGVIPFGVAGRPVWPLEAFTVFDDTRISVELLSAQVTVTAPSEIVLYARAFEKLSGLAVYGDEARALITDAIGAL